jgi:hypothetical protein
MRKLKYILTVLVHWATEKDIIFFNRFNHIQGFYQNYTKVGPFLAIITFLLIGMLFVPIFVLKWLTGKFNWSPDTHNVLYFIYIMVVFGSIFTWLVGELLVAIRRRSAIRSYAKKRIKRRY